jgi:hypothetical protein
MTSGPHAFPLPRQGPAYHLAHTLDQKIDPIPASVRCFTEVLSGRSEQTRASAPLPEPKTGVRVRTLVPILIWP